MTARQLMEETVKQGMKMVRLNLKTLLVLVSVLATFLLVAAFYLGITHRRADASVNLESPSLSSRTKSLHHGSSFRPAVAAILSPIKSHRSYHELGDMLARKYGLPLEFMVKESYAQTGRLLKRGEVDMAFVGTVCFISARNYMEVLASPVAEGKQARSGKNHQSWVLQTGRGDILHLAYLLEGRPGGFLHLGFSLKKVDAKLKVTARHLISSMSLGLFLSALVGGIVYRRMARPISELTDAASELGAGNLNRRVNTDNSRDDEVSLLAATFNRMGSQLHGKVAELESSLEALAREKARIQAILDGMMHGVVFTARTAESLTGTGWPGITGT